MKVELDLVNHVCRVTKQKGDPTFRNGGWGSGESRLLYHVKKHLIAQGHDIIKKLIQKDGHMFGDQWTHYLRTRSPKSPFPHIYVYDGSYAIRNAAEDFNTLGKVTFMVETEVFDVT